MSIELEDKSIEDRFNHLVESLQSQKFLKMEGLGNEVPFFICPFKDIKEYNQIEVIAIRLKKQLENSGINILHINLYDLSIELIKDRGRFDSLIDNEKRFGKEQMLDFLQNIIDPEQYLIPAIKEKLDEQNYHILFISGVGEVYPYIRTNNVLNCLQSKAKDIPTFIFFPGDYKHSIEFGANLNLFGRLPNDNYYRAFNIYKYMN